MYSNWIFFTYIGLTLGNIFPQMQNWGLDFAMSVTFLCMVIPYLKSRPIIFSVLVSAFLAVVSKDFPHKLGLLLASFSGIAIGLSLMLLEECKHKNTKEILE
jgi:predicted branched-subunit amino acid permease